MRAAFGDPAVIHNKDPVGIPYRCQTVGNGDYRFALCQLGDSLLNEVFVLGVYACGRLVKDDDRSVLEDRAGDGDALFLSAFRLRRRACHSPAGACL